MLVKWRLISSVQLSWTLDEAVGSLVEMDALGGFARLIPLSSCASMASTSLAMSCRHSGARRELIERYTNGPIQAK
jgi:hypothetical protein